MKLIKILLNALAILVGAIMIFYAIISLFESFNGLIEADGPGQVGFSIGYLIFTIIFGSLFFWIFWRGVSFFNKKKEVTKAEIEKMIDDVDS